MSVATASVRTKVIAAVSTVAIALGVGVAGAGAAQAVTDTGSISGTVTLPADAPSQWTDGVAIRAFSDDHSIAEMVEPDGTYTISDLPPGSYRLELWTEQYWDEDANDYTVPPLLETHVAGSPFGPNAVPLTVNGSAITGIDLQLQYSYVVSGKLTIPGGKADESFTGVDVRAIDENGAVLRGSVVDNDTGLYTLSGLPAGKYVIQFLPGNYVDSATNRVVPPRLQGEYYDNVQNIAQATVVEVADGDVTGINAELALLPSTPRFVDVSSNRNSSHYTQFHRQIHWLSDRGITNGYQVGHGMREFRPKESLSREAMAAFLYRLAGRPDVSLPQRSPFTDVKPSAQFYKEIVWLNQEGISTGWDVGNGKREFRAKESITRDAMAAFLYRAAGKPSFTAPRQSPFVDTSSRTKFYKEITWLASTGISTGWDVGSGRYEFRTYNDLSREAMAAFLYRFDLL